MSAADGIALSAPDPAWPAQYAAEAARLVRVLPAVPALRLEHFGSTAVPNLRAKPVIDILVIHPQPERWPQLIAPIESLGYVCWRDNPRSDRLFFVKGMPPYGAHRTHHVHVRVPEDAEKELAFRDLLRADSDVARRYEALKDELAARYPLDREAYTEAKTGFIEAALRERLGWPARAVPSSA